MNKRKAILFALLALVASSLFMGCDQVLEFLYPDFKEGGSEKGKVVVTVGIDSTIESWSGRAFPNNQCTIAVAMVPFQSNSDGYYPMIWPPSGDFLQRANYSDFLSSRQIGKEMDFIFPVKKYTTYKVIAWLDVDNNGEPTNETEQPSWPVEPSALVFYQDYFLDLRYHTASDASIYMRSDLNSSSRINWEQFNANPDDTAQGTGQPPYMPDFNLSANAVNSGTSVYFDGYSTGDPDGGWIQNYRWTFVVPGIDPYERQYEQNIQETFTNYLGTDMTVNVKLEVQDNNGNWSPAREKQIIVLGSSSGYTNKAPVASIGYYSNVITDGEYIYLWSNSYDPDNNGIYNWEWKIGETIVSQYDYINQPLAIPEDETSPWTAYVGLRVMDGLGTWSAWTPLTIYVYEAGNSPVNASFYWYDQKSYYSPDYVGVGSVLTFYNDSYDPDEPDNPGIASIQWSVTDPNNNVYAGGTNSSMPWTMNVIGDWTIHLDVFEVGSAVRTAYLDKTITVYGGTYDNPYVISWGTSQTGTIPAGGVAYCEINSWPTGGTKSVQLQIDNTDLDLYVYSDRYWTTYIGGSAEYGFVNETVNFLDDYSSVFLYIYNPTGMDGNFSIKGVWN